jgi:hypothetical protein
MQNIANAKRRIVHASLLALLQFATLAPAASNNPVSDPIIFRGMCDASAAVALGNELFAVANDEDNTIRIYHSAQGGVPVASFDFSLFLRVDPKSPETDLEGAAWLDNRIFWMASHGRNHDGKFRASRDRFFATTLEKTGNTVRLVPAGKPYTTLLVDLIRDPRLKQFKLGAASMLPPKHRGALNIEGLCATPDKHLLIGFRNPIPRGRALIVPLLNPNEVINGSAAQLGDPILLNLGGQGIRDIGLWHGKYLIIAGSYDAEGISQVYLWKGGTSQPQPLRDIDLHEFNPEAVIVYPDNARSFQLLSDDGTRLIDGLPCKRLPNSMDKQFRTFWVTPDK